MTFPKTLLMLVFSLSAGLAPGWGLAADVAVGQPAPALRAKRLDQPQWLELDPARPQVTVINFWASWCAPCRAEMPALQQYYEQHRAQGLQVIAINLDAPQQLAEVRRIAQGYTFPVALKAEAQYAGWGRIWRVPSTFVVDRQGILRHNGHEGDAAIDAAWLDAVVTPLLPHP